MAKQFPHTAMLNLSLGPGVKVNTKKRFIGLAAVCMVFQVMLLAEPAGKKTIVGVWEVKVSPAGESQPPLLSLAMFGGDGSFTTSGGYKALPPIPALQEVANELGPAFGRWAPTGGREFRLTSYAVTRKAGSVNGFQRVQDTLALSESGDEYTGHALVDFLDADWNVVFSTTRDVKGSRLETPTPSMLVGEPAGKKGLVGVWEVKLSPVGQSESRLLSLAMFGGQGSFTTAGGYKALPPVPAVQAVANEIGLGYGFWAATGAREFRLTWYAVMRKAGLVNGFQRVRDTLVLSESGDEYTGHAEVEFLDANWNVVFSTDSDVKGTRLEIPAGLVAQPAERKGVWEVKVQPLGMSAPPGLGLNLFGEDGSFSFESPRPPPSVPAVQAVANETGPSYGRLVQTGDRAFRLVFYTVMWKAGLVNGFVRVQGNQVSLESGDEFAGRAQLDYFDANWTVVFSMTSEVKAIRLETPGQD
jgi:hypothetical protein